MSQHHRSFTPRIARMMRELDGTETAPKDAVELAKSVTDRGADLRKRTAELWFKASAAGVVPSWNGSRVRAR